MHASFSPTYVRWDINPTTNKDTQILNVLAMLNAVESYSRQRAVRVRQSNLKYRGMTMSELQNECIARGIDFLGDADEITARLEQCISLFAKTPLRLAKFVASLRERGETRFVDLMAGHGNIAMFLPQTDLLAVEKNETRANIGEVRVPEATWVNYDIQDPQFIESVVVRNKMPYDRVFCNPDFECAFRAIFVALMLIRGVCHLLILPTCWCMSCSSLSEPTWPSGISPAL